MSEIPEYGDEQQLTQRVIIFIIFKDGLKMIQWPDASYFPAEN